MEEYERLDAREKRLIDSLSRDLYMAYSGNPDKWGQIDFNDLPVVKKQAWIRTAMWVVDETFTYETSYSPSYGVQHGHQ